MGVTGLWPLLEPVGRRVNIETLAGKKVAIDASIWVHQFVKAMRDSRGEPMPNAHLLGFFRRACRLLFHRIKPVFVFDGATPLLKQSTLARRRARRERADVQVRQAAERILLAQLRRRALVQVAAEGNNGSGGNGDGGAGPGPGTQAAAAAAALAAAANGAASAPATAAAAAAPSRPSSGLAAPPVPPEAITIDDDEDAQLAAAIELSLRPAGGGGGGVSGGSKETAAATTATAAVRPPPSSLPSSSPSSSSSSSSEDSDDDDGLDILVPADGAVDPEALSALPPSVQLEVLQRARDAAALDNRERFASASAAAPGAFSGLQMREYLRASALRARLESARDALNATAAGNAAEAVSGEGDQRGNNDNDNNNNSATTTNKGGLFHVGGAPSRRIAAEAGREYVLARVSDDGDEPGGAAAAAAAAAPGPFGSKQFPQQRRGRQRKATNSEDVFSGLAPPPLGGGATGDDAATTAAAMKLGAPPPVALGGRPKTLEEIGAAYSVTRERIRQIEAKALLKLRAQPERCAMLAIYTEDADDADLSELPWKSATTKARN